MRRGLRKLGATLGLAQATCGRGGPEQVYVAMNEKYPDRPVVIEGWVGYRVDSVMQLTAGQARELLPLLAQACGEPEMIGVSS